MIEKALTNKHYTSNLKSYWKYIESSKSLGYSAQLDTCDVTGAEPK